MQASFGGNPDGGKKTSPVRLRTGLPFIFDAREKMIVSSAFDFQPFEQGMHHILNLIAGELPAMRGLDAASLIG